MLNSLKNLFSQPHPLVKIARGGYSEPFIHELCESQIFVIAQSDYNEGLPTDSSHTKIMTILENEATRVKMRDSFDIYTYKKNDAYQLPFFTDQESAQKFCNEMAEEHQKIFPFTVVGVSGRKLAKFAETQVNIVMNDKTASAYELTEKDRMLLIALYRDKK